MNKTLYIAYKNVKIKNLIISKNMLMSFAKTNIAVNEPSSFKANNDTKVYEMIIDSSSNNKDKKINDTETMQQKSKYKNMIECIKAYVDVCCQNENTVSYLDRFVVFKI
jgi:hypothetical protein